MGIFFGKEEPVKKAPGDSNAVTEDSIKEKEIIVDYFKKPERKKEELKETQGAGSSRDSKAQTVNESKEGIIKFKEGRKSKEEGIKFKDARVERVIEYKEPLKIKDTVMEEFYEEMINERVINYYKEGSASDDFVEYNEVSREKLLDAKQEDVVKKQELEITDVSDKSLVDTVIDVSDRDTIFVGKTDNLKLQKLPDDATQFCHLLTFSHCSLCRYIISV